MKRKTALFLAFIMLCAVMLPACSCDGIFNTATYAVTFDANGGTNAPGKIAGVEKNATITAPDASGMTRAGFAFTGKWYYEAACSTEWDFESDKVTADMTLYASWTDKATVTFDLNGGTNAPAPLAVAVGQRIMNPLGSNSVRWPQKHGCEFMGWFKDAACTQEFIFTAKGSLDRITGDTVLYAGWEYDYVTELFYPVRLYAEFIAEEAHHTSNDYDLNLLLQVMNDMYGTADIREVNNYLYEEYFEKPGSDKAQLEAHLSDVLAALAAEPFDLTYDDFAENIMLDNEKDIVKNGIEYYFGTFANSLYWVSLDLTSGSPDYEAFEAFKDGWIAQADAETDLLKLCAFPGSSLSSRAFAALENWGLDMLKEKCKVTVDDKFDGWLVSASEDEKALLEIKRGRILADIEACADFDSLDDIYYGLDEYFFDDFNGDIGTAAADKYYAAIENYVEIMEWIDKFTVDYPALSPYTISLMREMEALYFYECYTANEYDILSVFMQISICAALQDITVNHEKVEIYNAITSVEIKASVIEDWIIEKFGNPSDELTAYEGIFGIYLPQFMAAVSADEINSLLADVLEEIENTLDVEIIDIFRESAIEIGIYIAGMRDWTSLNEIRDEIISIGSVLPGSAEETAILAIYDKAVLDINACTDIDALSDILLKAFLDMGDVVFDDIKEFFKADFERSKAEAWLLKMVDEAQSAAEIWALYDYLPVMIKI